MLKYLAKQYMAWENAGNGFRFFVDREKYIIKRRLRIIKLCKLKLAWDLLHSFKAEQAKQ